MKLTFISYHNLFKVHSLIFISIKFKTNLRNLIIKKNFKNKFIPLYKILLNYYFFFSRRILNHKYAKNFL